MHLFVIAAAVFGMVTAIGITELMIIRRRIPRKPRCNRPGDHRRWPLSHAKNTSTSCWSLWGKECPVHGPNAMKKTQGRWTCPGQLAGTCQCPGNCGWSASARGGCLCVVCSAVARAPVQVLPSPPQPPMYTAKCVCGWSYSGNGPVNACGSCGRAIGSGGSYNAVSGGGGSGGGSNNPISSGSGGAGGSGGGSSALPGSSVMPWPGGSGGSGSIMHRVTPRPAGRGAAGGLPGFSETGSGEFDLAIGSVHGLRQWSLATPDLNSDPLSTLWMPKPMRGATGAFDWQAGVNEASCNRDRGHQPPVDIDEMGVTCGCVDPGTRVLTADLRWVPAGDLSVGEHLLAFDEYPADPGYGKVGGRKYRDAVVACTDRGKLPCYDLQFDDGTTVRVSSDHRWLCYSGQKAAHWVRTDELRAGDTRASHVVKPFTPWESERSYEAGYLAAAFDGEGHLFQGLKRYAFRIGFCQVENPMLAKTEQYLKELGFQPGYGVTERASQLRVDGTPKFDVHRLTLSDRPELLRFLGSVRPVRLLPKFQPDLLGRLNMANRVHLVSKTYVGEREVVKLGTTAGTYFAEGMASHNCGFWAYWSISDLATGGAMGSFNPNTCLPITGLIEGTGRVLIGERGFRCQRAKIVALAPAFSVQAYSPPDYGDVYRRMMPSSQVITDGTYTAQSVSETEQELVQLEAQQRADAWMGVIQDRLGLMYPEAKVYATLRGMLASVRTGENTA